jgi:hypothetical protein
MRCANALHGRDNARVRTTTADIAAHSLSNFYVGQLDRTDSSKIAGYITGIASAGFSQHRNCGTELPGSTVPALKTIILYEGRLDGVQ